MTTTPDFGSEATDPPEGADPAGAAEMAQAAEEPRPLHAKPPSLKPALFVLACVAVVSIGGFALALVGNGGAASPTVSGLGIPVPGVNLSAIGAAQVLRRITSAGSPPSDVLDSLVVPNGARIISTTSQDAEVDQYDRSIYFEIDTTSKELLKFYQVELKRARWSPLGTYPLPGAGEELLARRAGSDGYEWEVGVVVTPVNPAISPSLAGGGQTSPTMGLSIRLFQIPDGS